MVGTAKSLSPTVNDNPKYSGSGGPALYNSHDTVSGAEWSIVMFLSMVIFPYFRIGMTTEKGKYRLD